MIIDHIYSGSRDGGGKDQESVKWDTLLPTKAWIDQELERGRGVEAELESLWSSFTTNSDDNPDPLAKQL